MDLKNYNRWYHLKMKMNIVFQQRWSLLTASWKLCFLWGALFPIISSVDHNLLWRTLSSTIGPVHNSCWLNVEVFLVWKVPEELFYHFHQEMCFREFLCWIKKFVWFLLYTLFTDDTVQFTMSSVNMVRWTISTIIFSVDNNLLWR